MTTARLVHVQRHPAGPRLWIAGQRVHHGATGCALMLAALRLRRHRRGLAVAGLLLVTDDRHDLRQWFRREGLPSVTNRTQPGLDIELSTL